ncbi:hypothetical protein AQUCO_11800014v1 [Aquilegia coerulea]|uniref:Pseudouridine synthase RsuA/RluA-like domain-containing protein n=1 Tax=Aquilegia coerulea TaxID=218851 RepID=A0A2G5C3C0_AQUCA|nr:hypothetical protein AQUCO_11800014v1 [Aquilegia coerulea]
MWLRPCCLFSPPPPPYLFFTKISITTNLKFLCNSSHRLVMEDQTINENKSNDPKPSDYPIPLSPPLPAISKQIELNRAMSASSLSSLFSLSSKDVIFEDEWLIVVNKPQGVYCENLLSSIPSLLMNSTDLTIPIFEKKPPELHLANRLDRDTSGLMVITKSHKVAGKLVQAFTDHKIRKTYIALCIGSAPKWENISIKSGHGRSKFGVWRVYAASDVGRTLPGGSTVRAMATTFQVLSVNRQGKFIEPTKSRPNEEEYVVIEDKGVVCGDGNDEVIVRAYPRSGRTHQIRLHCQYLGIPIRGDVKYEGFNEWKGETFDGHSLHAETLLFDHPVTGLEVELRAPLPLWASQALQPEGG